MNYTSLKELEQWLKQKKFKGLLSIQDKDGVFAWESISQSFYQVGESIEGVDEDE